MPRLSDSVPKYRKHRASGQAVVTLSGRDYYLGPHGTKASRREYDRLIGEWLACGRQSLHVSASNLTVAELCVRYLKHARRRYVKNGRPTGEHAAIAYAAVRASVVFAPPGGGVWTAGPEAVRNAMIDAGLAISTSTHRRTHPPHVPLGRGQQLLPSSVINRCGP